MSELEKKLEQSLRNSVIELRKARKKLEALEEPIAIIGMSCQFPSGSDSPEDYWELLINGEDGISEIPKDRWDAEALYDPDQDAKGKIYTRKGGFIDGVDLFDADFFRISPREARNMDPQQRLLLEKVWEALERAGIAPESLENSATGVFIGASFSEYSDLILLSGSDKFETYSSIGGALSALNGRVSYFLGLTGPSLTVDTACSSSLMGLHLACMSLQRSECSLAITGGINLMLLPDNFIMLSRAKMLAPDGYCKTFDASADGYSRGEGVGVLILKRLSDAKKDRDNILAVIRATSVNQDGASAGITVPNREAQAKLISKALEKASLKSTDVSYVEAHGTGTILGDTVEVGALTDSYGKGRDKENPLLLGSVKSNIGHLEAAAGVAGVIKLVLSLNHEILPPNLHFKQLNPKINLEEIPAKIITSPTGWKRIENHPRRAGISGFGYTGTNVHAIIEEPPLMEDTKNEVKERDTHILTLSAKTESALKELIQKFQSYLLTTDASLADICYTANTGRNHEQYRIAVIASTLDELRAKLSIGDFIKGEAKEKQHVEISNIHELADAYAKGAIVDWNKLEADYNRLKVILPTYPFQRKSYWLTTIKQASTAQPEESLLYEWKWKEYPLKDVKFPESLGRWLIIGDKLLVQMFESKGGSCKCVDLPTTKDDFIELLREQSIDGILHFPALEAPENLSDSILHSALASGSKSFLSLTQALIQENLKIPVILLSSDNLLNSPLNGMFKTVILEHPDLNMKHILLENAPNPNTIFESIFGTNEEDLIKISNNHCYVPRFLKAEAMMPEKELIIRPESTYLITGGLGGLGVTLSKWLIEKGVKNLVLTGRRTPDSDILNQLATPGTHITYEILDVGKEEAVEKLLSKLGESLKGIFHLAGVVEDAPLTEQNWQHFEKVFYPKVYGSTYLHLHSKNLDYFVLFSSLASTLGNPGQVNYAGANAFMDALAHYRRDNGQPAHCFSWGPWAKVGMAKDLVSEHERGGLLGIDPEKGMSIIESALKTNRTHIHVGNIHWKNYIDHLIRPPSWLEAFTEKKVVAETLVDKMRHSLPNELEPTVRAFVIDVVRIVLGIPLTQRIDEEKGFFDMGVDSLMAIEMKNRLQVGLGSDVEVDNFIVFNHPTVKAVTNYLCKLLKNENLEKKEIKAVEPKEGLDSMNLGDIRAQLKKELENGK